MCKKQFHLNNKKTYNSISKMGRGFKQTILQIRYINGQEAHKNKAQYH